MYVRHCKHENMAADHVLMFEGACNIRNLRTWLHVGREERENQKCRPGKRRKEETVGKWKQMDAHVTHNREIKTIFRGLIYR